MKNFIHKWRYKFEKKMHLGPLMIIKVVLHETYTPFFKAKTLIKDSTEIPTYYTFSESQISEFNYGLTTSLKNERGALF